MSSENNSSSTGGISTLGFLGVAFIVLKLTGFINWSWWIVLLPFYGVLGLVLLGIVIYSIYDYITDYIEEKKNKKKENK